MSLMKIADFSTHFSGPLASHLLAELGAEVIKVEHHRVGDGNREIPPLVGERGESVFHATLSAGARSIAANSRSEEWPELVAAAVRWADVVILSGHADALESRGLGFETLAELNDRLVYCMIPAFGNTGPWRSWTAHGQGPDAMAGTVELVDTDDGRLTTPPNWRGNGTTMAGTFAAMGILAAMLRRGEVKGPQMVEVSLWGASLWSSWRDLTCLVNAGIEAPLTRDRGSRYGIYRTRDGRALQVAPLEEKFWKSFCEILDLPEEMRERGDWTTRSMDFGAGEEYEREVPIIAERLASKDLEDWARLLGDAGIPIAPVYTLEEAAQSEHARAERALRDIPARDESSSAFRTPRMPVHLRDVDGVDPLPELGPAPLLGEHSDEVRRLWGLPPTST